MFKLSNRGDVDKQTVNVSAHEHYECCPGLGQITQERGESRQGVQADAAKEAE
jgi:hypothetical protein